MSIGTPNGILDITGATLRVSKMEFRQSTGFDTVLNNVARNTMLLMDETEQTTSNSWALKLPNAWVAEFHGYWASGSSGAPILFNFYNDSTSGTNGYTLSMNDTTISINYDGGSTLGSATLSSTLNNDTYRKVAVIFERSVLDVSVDGEHVFHFADSQLRDRVYDNNSGYVTFTHSSTDERKLKNLKFTNGDKWVREIDSSNIAYVGGNVGIGTTIPGTKLDVSGTVRGTHLMGDGSAISAIQSSNVSDFGSNVTRIGTLETDLGDNSSRITNLSSNLSDNSSRITALETGNMSISGDKTFTGDIIFESNIHMNGGNVFVANTVNMTVSDPIIELGLNNIGTNDLGIIMTRPAANSNVAVVFDESDDILRMGYTLNGASDSIVDLDSNALAVSVQGALSAGSNLEVGTANLFVDTTTSNVGVGVSSPAYKLDVGGDVNLSTGSTLRINGTPAVFSNWTVNGSDIYRSSGNVGIGTASPRGMLDIYTGATSTAGLIIDRYASGTYRSELYQESNGLAIKVGDGSNAPTENMRITRSDVMIPGRLALGTSTASSSQFYVSAPGNGTSTSTGDFHVNNSAGMTLYGTRPWITTTNGQGHTGKLCSINLYASGHQPAIEWTRDTGQGTNQRNWLLRQETDDALYTWHYNGSAWSVPMYVKSDAVISQVNVGIGTASPNVKLDVVGGNIGLDYGKSIEVSPSMASSWTNGTTKLIETGWGTGDEVRFYTPGAQSATQKMVINSYGNVGIGTTSPNRQLQIYGDSSNYFSFSPTEADDTSVDDKTNFGATSMRKQMMMRLNNRTWYWGIINNASNNLGLGADGGGGDDPDIQCVFQNNGTFWTKNIRTSGNVGIGTATPNENLEIYGTGMRIHDPSSSPKLDFVRGGTSRSPNTSTFGQSNYSDWRITADGPSLYFQNQYTGGNSGNLLTAMTLAHNSGNVGIGTASPAVKLHVHGSGSSTGAVRYFNYSGGMSGTNQYLGSVTLRTSHGILSGDYVAVSSDERIKKNIIDADDAECLDTLRLLKPKKYRYRDEITKGTDPVWGFIAQEVREILPHSTVLQKKTVPNIYELANVSSSNVITFTNFNTADLESNATTVIKSFGPDNKQHDIHLEEVIDAHSIRVKEDLTHLSGSFDAEGNVISEIVTTTVTPEEYEALEDKTGYVANITGYQNANVSISVEEYNALEETSAQNYEQVIQDYTKTITTYPGNQLFVYGQQVDDFVFLKKEAIWTVATAALQEVDRQLQAEKAKVADLLARVTALENT